MRVAIPVWEGRISPVFDTAGRLLVVDVENEREVSRSEGSIDEAFLPQRANRLVELGVDTLICGAISRPMMALVRGANIGLMPFVSGKVEDILQAFLSGRLPNVRFMMPGCCGRMRRGRRHKGGWQYKWS